MPSLSLKPQLSAGVRRDFRVDRNQAGLVSLVNACVSEAGLYPYEPMANPISITSGTGVPALEVFRGPTYIVAFGIDDKVYTLADDDTDWTETEITSSLKSPDDVDTLLTLNCDTNQWHFAAFQKGWIATNGICALYSVQGEGVYLDVVTFPLCVCSFRGRVFYGGLARHWSRFNANGLSADMWGQSLTQMSDSWIGWCTIQGRDILQHVFPERAVSSSAGRVGDELLANGAFTDGNTDWFTGVGWTYTTGPNRMVAVGTNGNVTYAPAALSNLDTLLFRLEIDLTRTAGSVTVSVDSISPGTIEYIGDLTLNTSGQHVVYVKMAEGQVPAFIRLTGTGFSGTLHSFSLVKSEHFDKFTSWEEQARLLQSGFSPASDQGDVLCIKALHDHVVVYGENFITAYSPVSIPSPTFGKVQIANFGIAGRRAVGGDLNKHLLCDVSGKLWSLDNQLNLRPEGWEEIFRDAVVYGGTSALAVGYDDGADAFYVSFTDTEHPNGTTCLLTAAGGLSQVYTEVVHSVAGTRGTATWADTTGYATTGDSDEFYMLTDVLDFEEIGYKTIKRVQVFGDGVSALAVNVEFRAAGDTLWRSGGWAQCNRMGEVYPEQSGFEFRLGFHAADYTTVRIYDIIVTFETGERINAKSVITRR